MNGTFVIRDPYAKIEYRHIGTPPQVKLLPKDYTVTVAVPRIR